MQILRAALPVVLAAGFSAAALTACGSSSSSAGDSTHEYPQAIKDNFMSQCSASSGGQTAVCGCAFDKIQAHFTLDQFKALDAEARNGGAEAMSSDAMSFITKAVQDCK
jgi:hypothetical protein